MTFHVKPFLLFVLSTVAWAQTGALVPVPVQQPLSNSGLILSGACMYTYDAGTSNPRYTFNDSDMAVGHRNANPIIFNSSGRMPPVYISPVAYKFVFAQKSSGVCPGSPGTVIWSQDNVYDFGALLKAALAATTGADLIGFEPTGGNVATTVGAALNSAFIYDRGFSTAAGACASTKTVAVTSSALWAALSTMTCAAPLWFPTGAGVSIAMAANQVFTKTAGSITAAANQKIFDTSASGSAVRFATGVAECSWPGWFGSTGDSSHDDTAGIIAAKTAAETTAGTPSSTAPVCFLPGNYKLTSRVTWDAWGQVVRGGGSYGGTFITWAGSSSEYPFVITGFHNHFSDIAIQQPAISPGGWAYGIDYEGSQAQFDNVRIDCNLGAGSGLSLSRVLATQSDQLLLNKSFLGNCPLGYGFDNRFNQNSLSITLVNPTIIGNFVGAIVNTGTNVTFVGGEYDYNVLNFNPFAGSNMQVIGAARSEHSFRTAFSSAGSFPQNAHIQGSQWGAINTTRSGITAAISALSSSVVFSAGGASGGMAPGDCITIAGAGVAGGILHTCIGNYTDATHMSLDDAAGTTVTAGAVALDGAAQQDTIFFRGGGQYVIDNNLFGGGDGYTVTVPNGGIQISNNDWNGTVTNPLGVHSPTAATEITGNREGCTVACTSISNYFPTNDQGGFITVADGTTAVDVSNGNVFRINNSGATSISSLTTTYSNLAQGRHIMLLVIDANTSFAGLNGLPATPFKATSGAVYTFVSASGQWYFAGGPVTGITSATCTAWRVGACITP